MHLMTETAKKAGLFVCVAMAGILSIGATEPAVFIDTASLVSGAAGKALLLQGGVSLPVRDADSFNLEAEFFYTAPSDIYTREACLVGVYRHRIFPEKGFYAGAGGGFGFSQSAFTEAAGGSSSYEELRFKAILLVEAGYGVGFGTKGLYMEPFFRVYEVGGKNTRNGTGVSRSDRLDSWTAYTAGAIGFRVGLQLPAAKGDF